ncbi:chromate transporter [bacterium]|nr:chromate transporter [bacterium]
MIYLDLFLGFLKVGCFAFGGAYAAIPLIRDVVLSYGWVTDETLTYMIAVSEMTPGPIMVNLATYVGRSQAGFFGAFVATFAVVFPAFLIMLLCMFVFNSLMKNRCFNSVINTLKPCVVGLILAVGIFMTAEAFFDLKGEGGFDPKALLITVLLAAVAFLPPVFHKKKISPITLIIVSAVLGIVVYGV